MNSFSSAARLLLTASLITALVACGGTPTPGGNGSSQNPPGNTGPGTNPGSGNPSLQVQNQDQLTVQAAAPMLSGAFYPDRLVFNKLDNPTYDPGRTVNMHDLVTLKLKNTGAQPLQISKLAFSAAQWRLDNAVTLPLTLQPGAGADLNVRFVATGEASSNATCVNYVQDNTTIQRHKCLYTGTLTITSGAGAQNVVQLAGYWQPVPEGNNEPPFQTIINDLFGYKTVILRSGETLGQGAVKAVGDEVLSPYWQRADAAKPAQVLQINGFHGRNSDGSLQLNKLFWFDRASVTPGVAEAQVPATYVTDIDGRESQTLLPRIYNLGAQAAASFTPSAVFGFKVDSEWSDPTLNQHSQDRDPGCNNPRQGQPQNCGHHVRFWPLKDRDGKVVANTYLMTMDNYSVNYDFNDDVYLVTNVKPATP